MMATLGDTVTLRGGDGRFGVVTGREYYPFTRCWFFTVRWDGGTEGLHHMIALAPLLPVLGAGLLCTLRERKAQ